MAKEASIEEKIRIRKKEKSKKRGTANRRMEPGQPKKKRGTMGEEEEDKGEEEEEGATKANEDNRNMQNSRKAPKPIPTSPPKN